VNGSITTTPTYTNSREIKEVPWEFRLQWKNVTTTIGNINDNPEAFSVINMKTQQRQRQHLGQQQLSNMITNNQEMKEYIQNDIIPLECPTKEEYEYMLNKTIEGEMFINQYYYYHHHHHQKNNNGTNLLLCNMTRLEELRNKHEANVRSYKYCHADLDKLFRTGSPWRKFVKQKLQSLYDGSNKGDDYQEDDDVEQQQQRLLLQQRRPQRSSRKKKGTQQAYKRVGIKPW
jgi:hypothetical protein